MIRKLLIGAIIALLVVPSAVLAAGCFGQNAGAAAGQGQCLQGSQDCQNASCNGGSCAGNGYCKGGQQKAGTGTCGCSSGQCGSDQGCGRSAGRMGSGSCGGCRNT